MKRSILGLMYLIHGMREANIDVDSKLARIGLKAEALDPNSTIHPDLEWDIQSIIAKDVEPELGLFVGQHYALAGYGPLLMLLVTSESVTEAIQNGIRFQRLTHLSGLLNTELKERKFALTYQPINLTSHVGLFRSQCEISGTYKFIQDIYKMVGLEVPNMRVELPIEQPKDHALLAKYQDYYGTALEFNCDKACFWFDLELLNSKIPSADPITFRVYESKCKQEIERLSAEILSENNLVQRVKDYIEMQKGLIPTMAETAQALNLPERTLRHQLQQLNTSYKQIREQSIKNKALKLMEYKEYSIEVISAMLGYSEPSAFNHAFKRWFGQSPRQYGK